MDWGGISGCIKKTATESILGRFGLILTACVWIFSHAKKRTAPKRGTTNKMLYEKMWVSFCGCAIC